MRFYDPGIGRFIARDMLAQAVALGKISPKKLMTRGIKLPIHSFAYLDSSPTRAVDPDGRITIDPNCPSWVRSAVTQAFTHLRHIADKEARACIYKELSQASIECKLWCPGDPCGWSNLFTATIMIYYDPAKRQVPGCPMTPALLVHEAAHKCKWIGSEKFSEACENEAFAGTRAPTAPGPGEAGGKCEL